MNLTLEFNSRRVAGRRLFSRCLLWGERAHSPVRLVTIPGMLRLLGLFAWLLLSVAQAQTQGQVGAAARAGTLRGLVSDPSGAVVPGAEVTLARGGHRLRAKTGADGRYVFPGLAPGSYSVAASAQGFARLAVRSVAIAAGKTIVLDLPLSIPVQKQRVTVAAHNGGVSLNPDENAGATVIKGRALDALSDDPDELRDELQALAGPAAGPNGGQIYIDGFAGGQLPPKSSILEIRVNQNPFSAEFERIGYGRVDIVTKPGSQKFTGSVSAYGTDSAFNTANPLVAQQPSYYLFGHLGDISGPLGKNASYFFNAYW
ncbi:MAG: carboxypeptidase regulatory-like domain-containing protein [Terriglobia bacterium]